MYSAAVKDHLGFSSVLDGQMHTPARAFAAEASVPGPPS
jgi:hypothetical protein